MREERFEIQPGAGHRLLRWASQGGAEAPWHGSYRGYATVHADGARRSNLGRVEIWRGGFRADSGHV
jgi:hypothetical protein